MRTFNYFYENVADFAEYINEIGIDESRKLLVRVHSTLHTMESIVTVAEEIKSVLPEAVLIGCSTSSVICEGKIHDKACLVSVTEIEDCELRLGMISCTVADGEEKSGEELSAEVSKELVRGDKGFLLLFMPLAYHKTAKFVKCMDQENPGLCMMGGVPYTTGEAHHEVEKEAYVLGDVKASASCMVGLMMVSPGLHIYQSVVNGVESVGRSYQVTKVHEHFIDEIENMDAAEWYEQLLGKEQLEQDPSIAGIFPLLYEGSRQTYNVIFEPYSTLPEPWRSKKQNRINLFSEIREGMRFSLSYFDPQKIVNQMSDVYRELQERPVEVLFAYDCLARQWMLNDCAAWEIEQFYTTNMSGAMLAGEINNMDGENLYANATFILAGLSEKPEAHLMLKEKELHNASVLQYNNVQMINYLLTMGNRQLNQELNEQQDKMKKAMFYNEWLELGNQTQYLFDCESRKLDKVAVFSLKNERILRLFLGRGVMQNELKEIYREAAKLLGEDFSLYSYGEYSLLAAAGDSVTEERFTDCVKQVFNHLNTASMKDIAFYYQCAVVMHEEDALQKAGAALQYGEKNKLSYVAYNDMPEVMGHVKEDLYMLQVIRNALMQDRVVPYFQGIYDNRKKCINMYEALIRIQDENGKIYFPNQFLPLAKEYDLYGALSYMMVEKVMKMFLNQNRRVTINLNVQDIYDREMIRMIFDYLKQEEHPENFVFELVESEEVQDYNFIKQFADSIHEYGAEIAIDDFGSGFSSIMHIIRIDADIIKIDGEIIKEICHDDSCREFLEMIYGWCSHKNKAMIAEYVENEEIQKVMEEIGITHSQGYHFAKPNPWEVYEQTAV